MLLCNCWTCEQAVNRLTVSIDVALRTHPNHKLLLFNGDMLGGGWDFCANG